MRSPEKKATVRSPAQKKGAATEVYGFVGWVCSFVAFGTFSIITQTNTLTKKVSIFGKIFFKESTLVGHFFQTIYFILLESHTIRTGFVLCVSVSSHLH
jgi:hypothetical protein